MLYSKNMVAKRCGITVHKLHQELRARGILTDKNMPAKGFKIYFKETTKYYCMPSGYQPYMSLKITHSGMQLIHYVLTEELQKKNIESYLSANKNQETTA